MFGWFALCFCLQLTRSSLLFPRLIMRQLENATSSRPSGVGKRIFHLEQNIDVGVYQITQINLRCFRSWNLVTVGCVSSISSVKACSSNNKPSSLDFTPGKISPIETLSKVTISAILEKDPAVKDKFCCYSDCNQYGDLVDLGSCNCPITGVRLQPTVRLHLRR